jgi:hypothetical protein
VFHANVKYEFWYLSNFSYTPVPNFTTKNNAIPVTIDVCLMMRNATVNDISDMSWRSVLLVEEIGGPGENHRPVASH